MNSRSLTLGSAPAGIPGVEVGSLLARGAMGSVFRAFDAQLGRPVALKWLPFSEADAELRLRFVREGRAIASLRHPNLVGVHRAGETAAGAYLLLELVEGAPLSELLEARLLGEAALTELAGKVALGLAAAHAGGVLHRDVKPANVVVDERGEPRLVDFGLARSEGDVDVTGSASVGTLRYMAPEVLELGSSQAGPPADVFALGVLLAEGLGGRHPFSDALEVGPLVTALLSRAARPLPDSVPAGTRALLARALARDPGARPSAAELAEGLLGGLPEAAGPAGTTARARQAGPRRPRGEAQRGEAQRGEAQRGEAQRGEALRGEAQRGEAQRGEALRGEAQRGEALRSEALRGEALRGEALRGEALRGEALRGEALRGEALRGGALRSEAQRGEALRRAGLALVGLVLAGLALAGFVDRPLASADSRAPAEAPEPSPTPLLALASPASDSPASVAPVRTLGAVLAELAPTQELALAQVEALVAEGLALSPAPAQEAGLLRTRGRARLLGGEALGASRDYARARRLEPARAPELVAELSATLLSGERARHQEVEAELLEVSPVHQTLARALARIAGRRGGPPPLLLRRLVRRSADPELLDSVLDQLERDRQDAAEPPSPAEPPRAR